MMEMDNRTRVSTLCALWKSTLRILAERQSDFDHEVNEEDHGTFWDSKPTIRDDEFGVPPRRFGDWQ